MNLEMLNVALQDARTSRRVVTLALPDGMQLRFAADPDRAALLKIGSAPSDADAAMVAAALRWADPNVQPWPLEGRAPGVLITPRPPAPDTTPPWSEPEPATLPPPPAPPFCPGKPFPGQGQLRAHQLYHLIHGTTIYTLSLRDDALDVQWRTLRGHAYGTTWRSFEEHRQGLKDHVQEHS